MRRIAILLALTAGLAAAPLWAQEPAKEAPAAEAGAAPAGGMGGYSGMRVDRVGTFVGSFTGQIEQMTDGVDITLLSDDPAGKPLPMRARTMKFEWQGDSKTPARIIMEGGVDIQHPQGSVKAEKAEWDFGTGELAFSGNPVMNSPLVKNMRGSRIVINFKKNTMRVEGMTAENVNLNSPEGAGAGAAAGDPALLTEADVRDWPGLIGQMKDAAGGGGTPAAQRVVSRLDPALQGYLNTQPVETLAGQKGAALKAINKMIAAPGLYDAEAFKDAALDEESAALAAKDKLEAGEQTLLNRRLLESAFPAHIAKH